MKTLKKILKYFLIIILGITVTFILYETVFYKVELFKIKYKLSNINDVEVLKIWGHDDITLEEIAARILIKNKGQIVLNNLSNDVKNYPKDVFVSEINGYSFDTFYDGGTRFSSYMNIGKNSDFWRKTKIEFNDENDIVQNFDSIFKYIQGLKKSPEINKIQDEENPYFLLIKAEKSNDVDPIYELYNVESRIEFAKKLNWN